MLPVLPLLVLVLVMMPMWRAVCRVMPLLTVLQLKPAALVVMGVRLLILLLALLPGPVGAEAEEAMVVSQLLLAP